MHTDSLATRNIACIQELSSIRKNERNHRENPRLVQNKLQWRLGT